VAPAPSGQAAAHTRVVAAIMGNPPTLSNTINSAGAAGIPGVSEVERLLGGGLSAADPQGTVHALLAEAVPSTENGLWRVEADGRMETTWHLRPGAVWHDGTPLTAEDLVFSIRIGQDKELAIFHDLVHDAIESAEAPDARTFVARWKRPFIQADALFGTRSASSDLTGTLVPRHLLEKPYLENKAALPQLPYWGAEYVGVGPFALREWVRDSHLVLAANDGYVLGRPKIDEIEVRLIPDSNTLGANILAGAVELTLGRNLSLDEALQISDQWRAGHMEQRFTSWIVMYPQLLNPQPPAIADVRLRRAALHALDRQAMADSLLRPGLSSVAHLFLGPNEPEFREVEGTAVRYAYDPSLAAQLLEAVGYRKGADGLVRDEANQPVTLEIRNRGIEIGTKSMFVAADYWKQLGLGAESVVVPVQRAQDRPYMATFPGFLLYNQPADVNFIKRIHGSQTPLPENGFVGQNNSRYMDPSFDALIDRYFVTIPRGERTDILREVVHQTTDQVLLLGLFYNPETTLISNRLLHVAAGPPWNAQDWEARG
jgi:peptide/nickel transport system substrate-binding protein